MSAWLEKLPPFKFKRDCYMKTRGTPAMLVMTCAACGNYVLSYQKDGPGSLKRCYLDRIHHPDSLKNLQHSFVKKSCPQLTCSKCASVIGVPIIYQKEKRPAYHLNHGSFTLEKIPSRKR